MVDNGEKWGIFMLMGEYHHTIDDKGRIFVPAKFRPELGEQFVVTRGLESCLFVYSMSEWNKIVSKLNTLPFTKQSVRNFSRFFLSGATIVELDKQGRINITSPLTTYASLEKECIIIGVGERLEIWNEKAWNEFLDNNIDDMSMIAEDLFSQGIDGV